MGGFVGYSIPIYKGFKVPQEKANNQTPQREFSVECDWQPQVTSQEIERKMITSHFHFLISFWTFGILHNSQQKNHPSPVAAGMECQRRKFIPFQFSRRRGMAWSLCRFVACSDRWGRARDPQLARGHSATNSGVLDAWVRVRRTTQKFPPIHVLA